MGETKYIFVTGGVASSLGKGIISSSIGKLLQARGYNVTIQKFDPYINIDPGTLNPYEHGEIAADAESRFPIYSESTAVIIFVSGLHFISKISFIGAS